MDADQTNMDVPACPGCVAAAKQIAELKKRNAELEARMALLEQKLEASLRSGKRQAAPFSRGLPKLDPKRPGRKSGDDYGTKAFRVVPPVIDEVHHAPLPERCRAVDSDDGTVHSGEVEPGWFAIRESGFVCVAKSSASAAAEHGVGR